MNELKRYKLYSDLTQKEIAEKIGLTESKVSRLMRVETSLKDVLTYSEYQTIMERLSNPNNSLKHSHYEMKCKGKYLEKYAKNGNLLRTAEKYGDTWIVSEYPSSKTNYQGEYTIEQFDKIYKQLF